MKSDFHGMKLRKPCTDCPFRTDVKRYLHAERYKEIAASLVDQGQGFTCHKHNEFDPEGAAVVSGESIACAGSMIWLQHQGKPNACMQIMERMGWLDPTRLRLDSPVWKTRAGFELGVEKP